MIIDSWMVSKVAVSRHKGYVICSLHIHSSLDRDDISIHLCGSHT
jgi:hypothetical protein